MTALKDETAADASASRGRGKQSLRLWLRILACENVIEQTLRAKLREHYSITLPQFDVLSELDHAGEALAMSQLSRKLMVSNGNVTGVVDRLEREGLVKRKVSPNDRRIQLISLTPKGAKFFAEMAAEHERWVTDIFADLNVGEMRELLNGMEHLKRTLLPHGNSPS